MIEPDSNCIPFRRCLPIERAGPYKAILTVGDVAGEQGQATAHILLVLRVNVCGLANVIDDSHTSPLQRGRLYLALLHSHPMPVLCRIAIICELHPEERKITLAESSAPVLHESADSLAVDVALAPSGFGLTLIPQRSFD